MLRIFLGRELLGEGPALVVGGKTEIPVGRERESRRRLRQRRQIVPEATGRDAVDAKDVGPVSKQCMRGVPDPLAREEPPLTVRDERRTTGSPVAFAAASAASASRIELCVSARMRSTPACAEEPRLRRVLAGERCIVGREFGAIAVFERRERAGDEDLPAGRGGGLMCELDGPGGQLRRAFAQAALRERPRVRPERVRRQDVRAGRDLVGVDRPDEFRVADQRGRAPERQLRVGVAALELGAHGRVEEERRARGQPLAERFRRERPCLGVYWTCEAKKIRPEKYLDLFHKDRYPGDQYVSRYFSVSHGCTLVLGPGHSTQLGVHEWNELLQRFLCRRSSGRAAAR